MAADSNDHDEVDDLLRGAMKTLDAGVPAGYLDALPNRIQERLEMQPTSSTTDSHQDQNAVMTMSTKSDESEPKSAAGDSSGSVKREEDSGLHDIRSLAQSTRMRVSQNMAAVRPGSNAEDDVLATSSAGWKAAVALPEPAKMISLPELAELPTKAEIKKAAKAPREKIETRAPTTLPADEAAAAVADIPPAAGAPKLAAVTPIGARIAPAKQAGAGNGMKIAIGAGLGIAAAAGIAFFVMNGSKKDAADTAAPAAAPQVATITPLAEKQAVQPPAPPPAPAAEPAPAAAPAGDDKPADQAAQHSPELGGAAATGAAVAVAKAPAKKADKALAVKADDSKKEETAAPKGETKKGAKDATAKVAAAGSGAGGEGEPSFDKLLDEAGVDKNAAPKAPKLDKKNLTGDDFKKGMAGVSSAAMACYQGTQGTASIKIVISPDGKVKSVNVTGAFAGKPEATCVANAVRGASFPAWDGGPQTFGYSYLLQEK